MKRGFAVVLALGLVLVLAGGASGATLMVDPEGAAGFWDQDGRQNANSFTVNSSITVTELGYLYPRVLSGDEFIEVALYSVAGVDLPGMNQAATQLGKVVIVPGDAVYSQVNLTMSGSADTGQLYLKALAVPVDLVPGSYAISATCGPFGFQAGNDHQFNAAPATFFDGGAVTYGGSFWDGDQNRGVDVWPGDPSASNQWNIGNDLDHAITMLFETEGSAVADAGDDFYGYESRGGLAYIVTLDGTASEGATTFLWEQIAGITVTLRNADTDSPDFDAPQWDGSTELTKTEARLRFRLTINQGEADEASDEVEVYIRIPGDATGDDVVNAFDLAKLRQGDPAANFNGDLTVNAFDLAILRQSSGRVRTVE